MSDNLPYSILVPAAITVAGWFIVARQADRREYRKETRERVNELKSVCDDVRLSAVSYWLEATATSRPTEAMKLKAGVKRLSRHAASLEASGLVFESASMVSAIRKCATGGDFEVKGRRRSPADMDRVEETAALLEDLLLEVDLAFYNHFRRTRPRFAGWLAGLAVFGLSADTET